jgi:hypothetical protein
VYRQVLHLRVGANPSAPAGQRRSFDHQLTRAEHVRISTLGEEWLIQNAGWSTCAAENNQLTGRSS